MNWPDILTVALAVTLAAGYLLKLFWPKETSKQKCGCGVVDCKVPKPEIKNRQS